MHFKSLLFLILFLFLSCTSTQSTIIEVSDPKDDFLQTLSGVSSEFEVSIEQGTKVVERLVLFANYILDTKPRYQYEKESKAPITYISFASKNFSYTIVQFLKKDSFKFKIICKGESFNASRNEKVLSNFLQTGYIEETVLSK